MILVRVYLSISNDPGHNVFRSLMEPVFLKKEELKSLSPSHQESPLIQFESETSVYYDVFIPPFLSCLELITRVVEFLNDSF
eukprot:CAMPEP_0202958478 /NCGR_PEP_ID=MMETSP1396-20130829/2812_1 /ASSEMBLY_ACC=CAM_ASM_000872 /TAXON_ID= /ORGANISM="Pseudokeronopsis sp., Strain Brazil" /LENGTH=81 /DNA_ID=CAMNT_0049676569 /DNA_START=145 /DNA_END=390 /DNA_ORIENTATION=-